MSNQSQLVSITLFFFFFWPYRRVVFTLHSKYKLAEGSGKFWQLPTLKFANHKYHRVYVTKDWIVGLVEFHLSRSESYWSKLKSSNDSTDLRAHSSHKVKFLLIYSHTSALVDWIRYFILLLYNRKAV